jgi:membrane protein
MSLPPGAGLDTGMPETGSGTAKRTGTRMIGRVNQQLRLAFQIFKTAAREWDRDNIPRHGAALAYSTLFALAPLLIIAIGVGGLLFGTEAAQGEVFRQIDGLIGPEGARAIQSILVNANQPHRTVPATIIAILTFFIGSTGAFAALQGSLNEIFEVKVKPRGAIWSWLRQRILSFGLVLAVGFLLVVSLTVSAAISALSMYLHNRLAGGEQLWQSINFLVSLGIITLLFALIYRVLPDVRLGWRDVWGGALVTSLLFGAGKFLIGLYLGHATITSTFGAAGSVVVIMIWVYYSSQVVLFGAELVHAWVRRVGSEVTGQPVAPVKKEIAQRRRKKPTS